MTRIEIILDDPYYKDCLARIDELEADRKFCRHTFQHVVDVARITYILLLESGIIKRFMEENDLNLKLAKELVYAAGVLHDIGRWVEYEQGEDHAVAGARLTVELLIRAGFNEKEVLIITTGIKEHRRKKENMSILGELMCRADNLSRLCVCCDVSAECYKYDEMETGRLSLIY